MNADERQSFDSLTERVLSAIFEVSNTLGAGYWEKVYQGALLRELRVRGIKATAQASFTVTYTGQSASEYFADILVEDMLVIELKYWSGSITSTLRNASTTCEPPSGPFVSSSISRYPKPIGSVRSRGLKKRNWLPLTG